MNKYQSVVSTIAKMLELEKVNWPRVVKVCKEAMDNGFTPDDFIKATEAMKKGDKTYWSIYSVFQKTDYWLSKNETQDIFKGVW